MSRSEKFARLLLGVTIGVVWCITILLPVKTTDTQLFLGVVSVLSLIHGNTKVYAVAHRLERRVPDLYGNSDTRVTTVILANLPGRSFDLEGADTDMIFTVVNTETGRKTEYLTIGSFKVAFWTLDQTPIYPEL